MKKNFLGFCVAMAFGGAVFAQDEIPVRTYCCEDATGAQICNTYQIAKACIGRAYRVIDQNGNVIQRFEAREQAEPVQKTVSERKKEEQKARADEALLDTYYSEDEITLVQKRQERTIKRNIAKIEERLEKAQAKRAKLEKQKKQYKKDSEVPQSLKVQLETANNEVFSELSLLDSKTQELEALNAKFDEERKRFRELTAHMQELAAKEEAKRKTRRGIDY